MEITIKINGRMVSVEVSNEECYSQGRQYQENAGKSQGGTAPPAQEAAEGIAVPYPPPGAEGRAGQDEPE